MAPQRQCWPPELNEDVIAEILLRIPPDEPAHLIRASVVCKLWLRVVSDPAFLCRYRAFHRGAPLLGFFFYNPISTQPFHGFVPTTAASLPPQPTHGCGRARWIADCRHGRVLREIGSRYFVVWDPFSDHWEELEVPISLYTFHHNAVVLCAVPGCDHHSCSGGPFHVVYVGIDSPYAIVRAHVYSSESRSWCTPASAQLDSPHFVDMARAAFVGDDIYCTADCGGSILKYDFVEDRLSLISMPPQQFRNNAPVLMQNEDGSLGIACVWGLRLYIWSRMVNGEGVTGWVQRRVIKLEETLPEDITYVQANGISFAEGLEVFFISTSVGAFTFELKSGRVRKVGEPRNYRAVNPFISFFTPDRGQASGQSNRHLAQL